MKKAALAATSSSGLSLGDLMPAKCWFGCKCYLVILVLIFGILPFSVWAQELPVSAIEIEGLHSISREELLYLLDLSEQRPLELNKVRFGIKRAFLKGIFEDIQIEKRSEQPFVLLVKVRELDRITAIEFAGVSSVSRDDLQALLPLQVGDRYRPGLMRQGCIKVAAELQRRGYQNVMVTQSALSDGKGGVKVVLTCQKEKIDRIDRLIIDDPAGALPFFKGISAGDLFDQNAVDNLLKKAYETLARRRYVNNKIETLFSHGTLHIKVRQGTFLDVDFVGNSVLGTSTLKKEITFYEANMFDENLVDESIVRMRQQYRSVGYSFVEIVPFIQRNGQSIRLTYYIYEGDQQLVKAIKFSGATITVETLSKQISFAEGEAFNPDQIEPNQESLQQFYRDSGYLSAHVDAVDVVTEPDGVILDFKIKEGECTILSSLGFLGNTAASNDQLRQMVSLKIGDAYNEASLSAAKLKIAQWYQKNGYHDIQIDFQVKLSDFKADVTVVIQEGSQTRFGKNIIVGNDATKLRVLQRELLHKEGEPFNPTLFAEERIALSRTGLFSSIEISPEMSDQGGERDVIYRVQEAPPGAVEFGFGYAEYEHFRSFFEIGHRNLWGLNDQASLRLDASSLLKRAMVTYYHPWVFDQQGLSFKALVIGEQKKELNVDSHSVLYKSDRYGASAGFEETFSPALKGELMYELSHVNTYDVTPGVILTKEDVGTLIISAVRLGVTYDRRDNPLDPHGGYVLGATFKTTGPYLLSETNFNKLVVYANAYKSLSKNIVAAVSLRGGFAKGFRDTNALPIVERFFLGGRTTVRGYGQDMLGPKDQWGNPTGGDAFVMGNFELRTKVWNDLGVVTFFDTGNVWTRLSDLTLAELKSSVGVGLRYNTPVGPLRVDYGRKLNRQADESPDAIHFSIGHAF